MGRTILHACGWLALLLLIADSARAESPILVRFTHRGDATVSPVAGVLLSDESRELRILDLRTLQERSFSRDSVRSLINPATEQDVAGLIGVAPLAAWFVSRSLPPPPKPGQVAAVDGAAANVNLGQNAGLSNGEKLDVFRGEDEIRDPATGEVLGRKQRRIATVEVVEVREKLSKVRVTGDFEVELQVGDVVRNVAAERAVAVLPFGKDNGFLVQGGVQLAEEITTYLTKNDVPVVERAVLDKVLGELALASSGAFDPDTAQQVGKLALAHAVVSGTIQFNKHDANVNVRLIEVETGKILYATSLGVKGLNATPWKARTGGASRRQPNVTSPATGADQSNVPELGEVRALSGQPDN